MASKRENQQARETVAAYQENCLRDLVDHVSNALDQYCAGQLDVFAVDETIHHYHGAARELWKFCWAGGGSHLRMIARLIDEQTAGGQVIDWWERGTPRRS